MHQTQNLQSKPNIILMVADDMGWSDLACYGGVANTPYLDDLAEKGIRFTSMYAAAPNCSPSRAGLLTGKSPAMLGMYNYRPTGHPMHLRDSEVTIAEILQNQGYSTAHFGKWHLGCLPQDPILNHPQPADQGFEYSFGTENNAEPSHLNPVNFVRNGEKLPEQKGYSCQILVDEMLRWMADRRNNDLPFFSYVAFHEPHKKVASPPELVNNYPDYPVIDAEYLANVENLDSAIGRIINYLEGAGLMENSIIIFLSDNGSYRLPSNGGLRAVKSYVYEGGIRVPGIFYGLANQYKGHTIDEPVGFVDVLPTICELLDIEATNEKEWEGTSLMALFNGQKFQRTMPLYWYFYRTSPEMAMRIDDHTILGFDQDTTLRTHAFSSPDMHYIRKMRLRQYELYNVVSDPGQHQNLIDSLLSSERYMKLINDKLRNIQMNGYYWSTLPEASGTKKIKTNWVKYERSAWME